jgi:hypothetical protein
VSHFDHDGLLLIEPHPQFSSERIGQHDSRSAAKVNSPW